MKTDKISEQITVIYVYWKHRNEMKIIIFKVDMIICGAKPEQLQFKKKSK